VNTEKEKKMREILKTRYFYLAKVTKLWYNTLKSFVRRKKMIATVRDIAEMAGVHVNTIRNWTNEGVLECRRDFRNWRRFPDPMKTLKEIRQLLNGTRNPKIKVRRNQNGR